MYKNIQKLSELQGFFEIFGGHGSADGQHIYFVHVTAGFTLHNLFPFCKHA